MKITHYIIREAVVELRDKGFTEKSIILPQLNKPIELGNFVIHPLDARIANKTGKPLGFKIDGMEIWIDNECDKDCFYIVDINNPRYEVQQSLKKKVRK